MLFFRRVRLIRTMREPPDWIRSFRRIVTIAVLVSLATIIIESGLRLQLPPAAQWAIRIIDWLVLGLFSADVIVGFFIAPDRLKHLKHHWFDFVVFLPVIILVVLSRSGMPLIIVRQFVIVGQAFSRSRRFTALIKRFHLYPVQLAAGSFLGLIVLGTVLLTFPAATADGQGTPLLDALFTATSAVCVTGLIVKDTPVYFSLFGQLVILGLIQLGGLGIMTLSTGIAVIFGRRLTVSQRRTASELFEDTRKIGIINTIRYIIIFTLVAETVGTLLLWARFLPDFNRPLEALYFAAFHSISAFCNAGFSLFSNSLESHAADPGINLVIMGLIIFGGLGFVVIHDIINRDAFRHGPLHALRRMTVHSRIVLVSSAVLIILGALPFFFFEYDNSLANLPLGGRLLAALFQSVTLRTAGFNTVPLDALRPLTMFICIALMFIGASPGGTGGGIKTTTLAVILLSIRTSLLGRANVEVKRRVVPWEVVFSAAAIAAVSAVLATVFFVLLLIIESGSFEHLLFETVSAFGTVGISTGITSTLGPVARVLVIVMMYVGRLGPLTLALAMRTRSSRLPFRYPTAPIALN